MGSSIDTRAWRRHACGRTGAPVVSGRPATFHAHGPSVRRHASIGEEAERLADGPAANR